MTNLGDVSAFLPLMRDKIVIHNPSTGGRGLFGTQAMTTGGSTYQAHIQVGTLSKRLTEGIDGDPKGAAWIASTEEANITRLSVAVLPDGSRVPVLSVSYRYDENGLHHTMVVWG